MEEPESNPVATAGRCQEPSCLESEVYRCCYRDRWGTQCPSLLCGEHAAKHTADGPLCRRHWKVCEALAITANSVLEVTRPDIGDRCFGLLLYLADHVQTPMLQLLTAKFGRVPRTEIARDSAVRGLRTDSETAWEIGWSAYSSTGNLSRISLRVPAHEPPNVQLLVNRHRVLEGTPDWIAKRILGESNDEEDRERYFERLVTAAQLGVDRVL